MKTQVRVNGVPTFCERSSLKLHSAPALGRATPRDLDGIARMIRVRDTVKLYRAGAGAVSVPCRLCYWSCALIDCSLLGMASLLASISKAAGGAVRIAAGMRCWHATVGAGCGLGHGAAGSHCGTGNGARSRTAVGAAAANDALEPTLTRGRDRLQATRRPTKAKGHAASRAGHLAVESIFFLSFFRGWRKPT